MLEEVIPRGQDPITCPSVSVSTPRVYYHEQPASQCDTACGDLTDAHRGQRTGMQLVAQPHLGQSFRDGVAPGVPDLLG